MKLIYTMLAALFLFSTSVSPGFATTQTDKMKSCNASAVGKKGAERKAYMKGCLSETPNAPSAAAPTPAGSVPASSSTGAPHCSKGKPCGNSCIAENKVCHK